MAADDAETVPQLHHKIFEFGDKATLQFALVHSLGDSQEFKTVSTLECFLCLLGKVRRKDCCKIVALILEADLICTRLDLVEEDIPRPAQISGRSEVVATSFP